MKRALIVVLLIALTFALGCTMATAQDQSAAGTSAAQSPTASTATPATDAKSKSDEPSSNYLIQSEDVIRLSVLGEPELSVEQVVDPKGYVTVPMVGPFCAQGLTRAELAFKIEKALSKYLVEPKVQLSLSQFRKPKVYVLGLVNRPGMVDFRSGDRIMEAIAQAGSLNQEAYLAGATLTHAGSKDPIPLDLHKLFLENDLSQNFVLQDGDTIYVPEDVTNRYFVIGEVNRPGKYPLKDKVSIVDALSAAGGVTQRADAKVSYIIRGDPKDPKKQQRIPVNITKFLKSADLSQNVALQPGDVIYVPETNKPDWNKIAGIISVVVNTSYLARMWGF